MLDEIQQQKLTLERQNIELQQRNERLDQAVDGLQTLRNEQFETARHTMLAPELTVLRHGLKAPLSKLKTAIDELQKNQTVMESYLGRSAMDRAELRNHSLQCGDLLQQAHNQVTQAITMVDAIQQQDRSLDMGEKSHFLVAPLLQACTQEIKPTLAQLGHQRYLRCPPDLALYSYPNALQQIINNLLSNSLHHAFREDQLGEIVITVKATAHDIQLSYRDNGRGIAPSERDKIFQPFYTTGQEQGGTGLGLYLVKQLVVLLLGGDIICQESAQPGAAFLIRIPNPSLPSETN